MKRRWKRCVSTVLAICLILTSAQFSGIHANAEGTNSNYVVNFDDANNRGGWQKVSGNGKLEFTDGEGDAGRMTATADGATVYYDANAPVIENGFIEADFIKNDTDGRFGFIYQYIDENTWSSICYDIGGNWGYQKSDGNYDYPLGTYDLQDGVKYHLRLEYVGSYVTLIINGEKVFSVNKQELDLHQAGKVGLRTWGYDTGRNQGSVIVDNFVVGYFNAVLLDPSSVSLRYNEAGIYDINVKLSQTGNELKDITLDGTSLVQGTDYTISSDKSIVTIKKEYIEKIKGNGENSFVGSLIFTFADEYQAELSVLIQPKPLEEEVSYKRNFQDGIEGFEVVDGSANLTADTQNGTAKITDGNGIILDQNSPSLYNCEVEYQFDPVNDNGNFGIVFRYQNNSSWTMIGQAGTGYNHSAWSVFNSKGQSRTLVEDGNHIYAKRVVPYKVKVRLIEDNVTIFLDNAEIYSGKVEEVTGGKGQVGLYYWGNSGASIPYLSVNSCEQLEPVTTNITNKTIASSEMTVSMDAAFPRVIDYTLTGGAKVAGQERPIYAVELNTKRYVPEVTSEFKADQAIYHMNVKELNVTFDVVFTVKGNTLRVQFTNINDDANPIRTFNFPEHSLVSIPSDRAGAEIRTNNYRTESIESLSDRNAEGTFNETSLVVLSCDEIAASIANDSFNNRKEVAYQTIQNGDHTTTGIWSNEYMYRGLDNEVMEEPWAIVSVTGDRNSDGKVDYQDGAIARRDDCVDTNSIKQLYGSDVVMNSFSSIAMNVGSAAQYPFLRILDNVQKFYLGTDGFAQNIIIKGYQSEGHDAAHPDYANYNKRAGGLEDMNTLLETAKDYNATVGVHINQTESYPEAKQYGNIVSTVGGWSWYDSSNMIIRENDLLAEKDNTEQRLSKLTQDTKNNLSMYYVDVYFDTRWTAYKLINSLHDKKAAVGTEYVDELTGSSVWAHQINSNYNSAGNLLRIVGNSQMDIFGGNMLFRDADTRNVGFNGWQNSVNYNDTIKRFFTQTLPNKYMGHFPISQYETANKAVLGHNNEVVTQIENGVNNISKDGKLIATGNKIFIPWDPETEETIYHWNENGGSSTWDLPDSWNGLKDVKLYELSDQGKSELMFLNVVDGKVTIEAKASTGYVIYKGDEAPADNRSAADLNWSVGSPVKDMGFDSHTFNNWQKASGADHVQLINNNIGNTHLVISGNNGAEGKVSQTITGLVPGQTYSASAWIYTTEGRKGIISVNTGTKEVSNYIDTCNVIYGVHHTDKYQKYAQRVKVLFTAESDTAELTLVGEAGTANSIADFDDVRVVKVGATDKDGHFFVEDFENVDQEYGPFISTESDNSHLSETNLPYTDDTIGGQYSMKVRYGDYLRTMPHTIRFKPNTQYKVTMDYKVFSEGFQFNVLSDKEEGDTVLATQTCGPTNKETKNVTLEFTTGNYDDYYLEVKTLKNRSGEYILDNLIVDEILAEKPLESISLNKDKIVLEVGGNETLTVTYHPEDTTADRGITWTSSNKNVATVDKNGKVTAVTAGTATITAKVGDKTATCTVTVSKKEVPLESIHLNKTEMALEIGTNETLSVSYQPENTTADKKVTWTSSDKNVATVDENGKVTAVTAGTATITAKVGDKTATCTVTVSKKEVPLESIHLNKTEMTLGIGANETLTVSYQPENTTADKKITWTSSDKNVAAIDKNGKVTAVAAGTATITAKVGDKTATCKVIVKEPVSPKELSVSYSTHVQNFGWQDFVKDGELGGTSGLGLRLEGIKIQLNNNELGGGIEYHTHVQDIGWQDYVKDGAIAGTQGQSLRLEAIQVKLTGKVAEKYDIYYRTHIQDYGWLGWAKNGEKSGSAGLSKRLEGIQVVLVAKGGNAPGSTDHAYMVPVPPSPSVIYQTHIQNMGWQADKVDGQLSGTFGLGLRLEGIKIQLDNDGIKGNIQYCTQIQNVGWQDYVQNGQLSGTTGRSLRLEGIRIQLTDDMAAKYDVYYRTHIQDYGWLGWAKNGEKSGSAGLSKRLEGIQIQLVPKGGDAPGSTDHAYMLP